MKYGFLFLTAVFTVLVCCAADGGKEELKPLDPEKRIFQVKDGWPSMPITWPIPGGLRECRLPDPVTPEDFAEALRRQEANHKQEIKEREREMQVVQHQREMRFGGWLKMAGWILLVLGGLAHCATNLSIIKNYSTMLFLGGVTAIVGGLAIQKSVQFDKVFSYGFWILIIGVAMVLLRNWSVSRIPGVSNAVHKVKQRMHNYKMLEKDG